MSHKEVEKKYCPYCESSYKLLYVLEETNTTSKFCPFCGEDSYDEDKMEFHNHDDED